MTTPESATPAATYATDNPSAVAAAAVPAAPAAVVVAPAGPAPAAAAPATDERYGAPEKGYAAPKVAFDEGLTKAIHEAGKGLNLSDKGMEKLYAVAEAHSKTVEKVFDDAHQANLTGWKADAAKDPEFGGEKFSENRAVSAKGMEYIATPELRGILKESGLEDHPEFFRVFYRVGRLVSEDRIVRGSQRPAEQGGVFSYGNSDHK